MLIKTLVRVAALTSAFSICTGETKWPDIMYISSWVMIVIWLQAEWDWYKNGKQ